MLNRRRLRRRRQRTVLLGLTLCTAASLLVIALAVAHNVGGFEIDADHSTPRDALYSGNDGGDDWTAGTSQEGVFEASASAPHTAAADCYGSNIDKTAISGTSALICDGNSDPKFKNSEPEQNIVSPSGKTPDDQWPIKPGNVRPKNDFSHGYVHASLVDSPCDTDTVANNIALHLAGHVGDNEGDHFWGFEFDKTAPGGFTDLTSNSGSSFTLDFNRQVGDFLVSFTVPGNTSNPVELEVFTVSGFQSDGDAIFTPAGTLAGCPAGQPQGFTLLRTNSFNDVTAPPWNVPVCDPTADNASNQCRLANGSTPAEDLLAPRDFAEASIDLTAFGIEPCVSNVIFTSRSAHVLEGADVQDVGGAEFPLCGDKSGTKFYDRNANGVRDAGEEGLEGWPIKLYKDTDGDGVLDAGEAVPDRTTTTDANGDYEFTSLANDDYIVCESAQPPAASGLPTTGWSESLPNAGTSEDADCTSQSGDSTLGAHGYAFTMTGLDQTGNDFGNYRNATKSGTKFHDLNGNGSRDSGEPGIADVQIHLFGTDGLGNAVHQHATTDVNGDYSFSVAPGSYTVCETVPTGYTQSVPSSGADCSAHGGGFGYSITLSSEDVDSGNDFGNFQQATKSGTKFDDLNANGVRDAGEPGIEGVQIHLFGTDGLGNAVHQHVLTDANGDYSFTVAPGSYTVCESVPFGSTQSFPATGADCEPHTGIAGSKGYAITLASGDADTGNDFGNFRNATISGMKFKDADAGGDKDAGEVGLGGWVIHLFGTDGMGNAVHEHTTTAADGSYSFGVKPGSYTVCEETSGQPGWVQSFPTSGADCSGHTHGGTVTPGGKGYSVTVISGGTSSGNDFGNTPLSRIQINFESLAHLPGGADATRATSISCVDASNASVGSVTDSNTFQSDHVKNNQSSLTCTITYTDP